MPLILRIEKQNYAFRQNYDFYDKHSYYAPILDDHLTHYTIYHLRRLPKSLCSTALVRW